MPPNFALPLRRPPYIVTKSSPRTLDDVNPQLDSKTLVIFQDLDGADPETHDTFTVQITVAKVIIHDVANLRITLTRGVVTTVEAFNCTNVTLELKEDVSPSVDDGDTSDAPGDASTDPSDPLSTVPRQQYGTVSLDPSLEHFRLVYSHPVLVGAIVLALPLSGVPDRKISDVTVGIRDNETYAEADSQGFSALRVSGPGAEDSADGRGPRQVHLFYDKGWKTKSLQRNEKDYPALDKN